MLTFDHVTMAEIATIERISGQPIGAIMDAEAPKGNLMAAMALVAKRRTGSADFTWDDAQALTLKETNEVNQFFRADDEDELEQELAANAAADEAGLTTLDPDAVAFDEQRAADGRGNVDATPPATSHPPID